MDERLGSIEEKLDRLLALLDAKEQKKQKDRVRVKKKRDEEAAAAAIVEGKIVVDNLSGTMNFDERLPYAEWAYIMLEFRQGYNFLRWLMHTYLESYHCKKDPRKRMIARKGNYWKLYKKCGSESLLTPSDLFGGLNIGLRWESILDIGILRWGCTHVNAVLYRVCTKERLPYVHEKHLPWDCKQANEECGAPKLLEAEFWNLSARYRERLHAAVGVRLRVHPVAEGHALARLLQAEHAGAGNGCRVQGNSAGAPRRSGEQERTQRVDGEEQAEPDCRARQRALQTVQGGCREEEVL